MGHPGNTRGNAPEASRQRPGGYSSSGWGGPVESVAVRGLFGWSVSLEATHTYCGLIPDGNATVLLTLTDGRTVEVPVVENIFIAQPGGAVCVLEFRDAQGSHHARETGITPDA